MPNYIHFNAEACNGCGVCAAVCPQMVFTHAHPKAKVTVDHPDRCFGCMACEEDCPELALTVHRAPDQFRETDLPTPGASLESDHVYDLVIIGAGPAGLGAAIRGRMLGLDVAVMERLPSPLRVHHPDGGLLFASAEVYPLKPDAAGLIIEDLQLLIPAEHIQEWLQDFTFIGPSGQHTVRRSKPWTGFPLVDKHAVLNHWAETARQRGAIIAYNTRACAISEPDAGGIRRVTIDGGRRIAGRVIISAEGITGRLTHEAGLKVNAKKLAWSYAPYADLPPTANPTREAAFMIGDGPGKSSSEPIPYLGYYSSGPHALHAAFGPIQKGKARIPDRPLTDILRDFLRTDGRLQQHVHCQPSPDQMTVDGCRIFVRELPPELVAPSLIAVGDVIATAGLLTTMLSLKTGDLAAQTAFAALRRHDTSAAGLQEYEKRVRKIKMYAGMNWMNNLLIRTPMELTRAEQDSVFDLLSHLELGRMQSGEIWPLISFYLRITPALFRQKKIRPYLLPS
jgi:2-oxoglutarate ferredoxin oxidoreductase subunit delta